MGLLIVPHPENPRKSGAHSRDYGVLVANPFPKSNVAKSDCVISFERECERLFLGERLDEPRIENSGSRQTTWGMSSADMQAGATTRSKLASEAPGGQLIPTRN